MTGATPDKEIPLPLVGIFIFITFVVILFAALKMPKDTSFYNSSYLCPNMSPGTEWYEKNCGPFRPFENLSEEMKKKFNITDG